MQSMCHDVDQWNTFMSEQASSQGRMSSMPFPPHYTAEKVCPHSGKVRDYQGIGHHHDESLAWVTGKRMEGNS